LASLKIATAHSLVMSGSLYEETTTEAFVRRAASTICAGLMRRANPIAESEFGSRIACDVYQFWQNPQ